MSALVVHVTYLMRACVRLLGSIRKGPHRVFREAYASMCAIPKKTFNPPSPSPLATTPSPPRTWPCRQNTRTRKRARRARCDPRAAPHYTSTPPSRQSPARRVDKLVANRKRWTHGPGRQNRLTIRAVGPIDPKATEACRGALELDSKFTVRL